MSATNDDVQGASSETSGASKQPPSTGEGNEETNDEYEVKVVKLGFPEIDEDRKKYLQDKYNSGDYLDSWALSCYNIMDFDQSTKSSSETENDEEADCIVDGIDDNATSLPESISPEAKRKPTKKDKRNKNVSLEKSEDVPNYIGDQDDSVVLAMFDEDEETKEKESAGKKKGSKKQRPSKDEKEEEEEKFEPPATPVAAEIAVTPAEIIKPIEPVEDSSFIPPKNGGPAEDDNSGEWKTVESKKALSEKKKLEKPPKDDKPGDVPPVNAPKKPTLAQPKPFEIKPPTAIVPGIMKKPKLTIPRPAQHPSYSSSLRKTSAHSEPHNPLAPENFLPLRETVLQGKTKMPLAHGMVAGSNTADNHAVSAGQEETKANGAVDKPEESVPKQHNGEKQASTPVPLNGSATAPTAKKIEELGKQSGPNAQASTATNVTKDGKIVGPPKKNIYGKAKVDKQPEHEINKFFRKFSQQVSENQEKSRQNGTETVQEATASSCESGQQVSVKAEDPEESQQNGTETVQEATASRCESGQQVSGKADPEESRQNGTETVQEATASSCESGQQVSGKAEDPEESQQNGTEIVQEATASSYESGQQVSEKADPEESRQNGTEIVQEATAFSCESGQQVSVKADSEESRQNGTEIVQEATASSCESGQRISLKADSEESRQNGTEIVQEATESSNESGTIPEITEYLKRPESRIDYYAKSITTVDVVNQEQNLKVTSTEENIANKAPNIPTKSNSPDSENHSSSGTDTTVIDASARSGSGQARVDAALLPDTVEIESVSTTTNGSSDSEIEDDQHGRMLHAPDSESSTLDSSIEIQERFQNIRQIAEEELANRKSQKLNHRKNPDQVKPSGPKSEFVPTSRPLDDLMPDEEVGRYTPHSGRSRSSLTSNAGKEASDSDESQAPSPSAKAFQRRSLDYAEERAALISHSEGRLNRNTRRPVAEKSVPRTAPWVPLVVEKKKSRRSPHTDRIERNQGMPSSSPNSIEKLQEKFPPKQPIDEREYQAKRHADDPEGGVAHRQDRPQKVVKDRRPTPIKKSAEKYRKKIQVYSESEEEEEVEEEEIESKCRCCTKCRGKKQNDLKIRASFEFEISGLGRHVQIRGARPH